MADGPNVIEKPITLGGALADGPNVIEKPITMDAAMADGPNVIEKPITFGRHAGTRALSIVFPPMCVARIAHRPDVISASPPVHREDLEAYPELVGHHAVSGTVVGGGQLYIYGSACLQRRIELRRFIGRSH